MSRDAEVYPDPDSFIPERFLDGSGFLDLSTGDPGDFVWGFGRRSSLHALEIDVAVANTQRPYRICPGRYLAEASLFAYAASILSTCEIRPPLDEHGLPKKLEHKVETNEGVAV